MKQTQHHPLRQLDDLDEELMVRSGYTGNTRWMIPYADLLTLLLGFFIVLFAVVGKNAIAAKPPDNKAPIEQAQTTVETEKKPVKTVEAADLEEEVIKALHLEGQQVTVSQDERGLIISFQERLFFGAGQATLSAQADQTLDKLAPILLNTHRPIRVEGHTDNTPIKTAQFPSNWELSTSRATTIVRSLVEKHHFPAEFLAAAGYAEHAPLADNSTVEGKQKNRRVDIVILNPLPQGEIAANQEETTAQNSVTRQASNPVKTVEKTAQEPIQSYDGTNMIVVEE